MSDTENPLNMEKLKRNTNFFDLHWEDIIVSKILPYLSITDCLNFRSTSSASLQITNSYFSKMKTLKLINIRISQQTFNVFNKNCKQLKKINLSKSQIVTDEFLLPVLSKNFLLTSLILCHCKNLSARCLQPVILYSKQLTILKLAQCPWMTTGALEALTLHHSNLESVDFSYCINLSESSIHKFIKKFRLLKVLSLEGNPQITDRTLLYLSRYGQNMRLLNVSRCNEISNYGIIALAANCANLDGVLTMGCNKVSATSMIMFKKRQAPESKNK